MTSMILTPGQMDIGTLKEAILTPKWYVLDKASLPGIHASTDIIKNIIAEGKTVYGVNTGFGSLAKQVISGDKLTQLQRNIVLSHACGTGPLLDDEVVSLILLLKVNALSQGFSGVRLQLIEALLALYNHQVLPCIPAKGSVGASGDLAPLAHMALPLLGVGEVRYKGQLLPAKEGLAIAGLAPMDLAPKEGLALLNGLQASAAISINAFLMSESLFEAAVLAGSLSVDAAKGSDVPFDDNIQTVRGHESQRKIAAVYRELLHGSKIRLSHQDCGRVQDPYSLRCQPQIMGAILHQIQFVGGTLQAEANAVTDNPLIFANEKRILSGGNFHGEMLAMAADNLALAIAEIGANAERRIALLIDANQSGLPPFLVRDSGVNSGFMIAHVTAAACASANKALAHPHSVDSLPTSANQEDIVSMATNGALRLQEMIDNTATILAIEFLAACQGIDFHLPLTTSDKLQAVYRQVRQLVPFYANDRYFAPDIAKIKQSILNGAFSFKQFVNTTNGR